MEARITPEDFDKAVADVVLDIEMRPMSSEEYTSMLTISGVAFSRMLRERLFREEK